MSSRTFHQPPGFNGAEQPASSMTKNVMTEWFDSLINRVAPCPWSANAGLHSVQTFEAEARRDAARHRPLYSPEERVRRDKTVWTLVQGLLAPVQFLAFGISVFFVLRYLSTGEGAMAATLSVLVKTALLYTIMVTGAIWEKVVFGRYLFAHAFFWEDVFSMLVLALHTAYLGMVLLNIGTPREQLILALAAYVTYVINAAQFIWKLRMARLEAPAKNTMVAA